MNGLIKAERRDDAFLADVHALRGSEDLHIWWLGQSGFLVGFRGTALLFDPYLSDSLTTKYAGTDKPHVRMSERVIDPRRLDFIDVVTSTHNHTDHLDAETLRPLLEVNTNLKIVIPEANRSFVAERLGVDASAPVGMVQGDTKTIAEIEFTAVPAAHETIETDDTGRCVFLGYVAKVGPWTIYHSGDTVPYDGMADILRPHDIDVALLPINGSKPERRVAGNLDGVEAASLAHEIGARVVIPCHYDMFEFNTVAPDVFVRACDSLGQSYAILRGGGRWSS